MTSPKLPWEISLGNILTIVVLGVGVAMAFSTVDARTQANAEKISGVSVSVLEIRREKDAMEARLRAVEARSARDHERMANILTLLARIDQRLDRIERSGQ